MLSDQRRAVVQMIDAAKSQYIRDAIAEADSKETFAIFDRLLNRKDSAAVGQNDKDRAETAAGYFVSKIATIRQNLDAITDLPEPLANDTAVTSTLSVFSCLTDDSLQTLIRRMPSKSCALDPIPTYLLKDSAVCNALRPSLLQIINHSVSTGQVPTCLKIAQVKPRPKKPGADILDPKNLRPISNLPTIEKLLERSVVSDLQRYLNDNNITDDFQSAYRPGHSTETAMLKVHNDIKCALDKGEGVLLVLLDLSAAFDTIDHQILLLRLQHSVGIVGTALDWLRSYLSSRKQFVQIGQARSAAQDLDIGVPQNHA